MQNIIPSTFENFKQRQLSGGIETCSTTKHKGFEIFIRAYAHSGIYYKIFKTENGKKIKLRGRHYNFVYPDKLLQEAKDYIDNKLIK